MGLNTAKEIGEVLKEANSLDTEWKIDERVEHADETLMDCMVLSSASSILKKCIAAVDVFTSTYEQAEFSNKIVSRYGQTLDCYAYPKGLAVASFIIFVYFQV